MQELLQEFNPWWRDSGARGSLRPIRRDLQPRVLRAVEDLSDRRARIVIGPRQVGKSELLRQVADDLLDGGWPPGNLTYFDFSDERLPEPISARDVASIVPPSSDSGRPRALLFDEIRQSTGWDRWLKQAVDRSSERIVATDSAASLIRSGSRESGLGRWDEMPLQGLSFTEFVRIARGSQYGPLDEVLAAFPAALDRYLERGGFPEHVHADSMREVRHRLREDIAGRAIARDLARFNVDLERVRRLFVYLVQFSGSVAVFARLAKDLGGADERSVKDWLQLLEDAHLLVPLQRREGGRGRARGRASRRLRARPKIYAVDHGLVTAFAASPRPLENADYRGSVWETVVFRHLRDAARSLEAEGPTYFRDDDDVEVDFVVDTGQGPVAIEVTSSRPDAEKLARLKKASERVGARRSVLIHGGVSQDVEESTVQVPLQTFLLDPAGLVAGREE